MTAIPITAAALTAELATVPPDARVYVLLPDETAVADGPAVTGLIVRGGDVYLEANIEEDDR